MSGDNGFLARIIQFLKGMGASKESDSKRDGAFSYSAENHAFVLGLGVGLYGNADFKLMVLGFAFGRGRLSEDRESLSGHIKDIAKEPAYTVFGMVLGELISGSRFVLSLLLMG